ncbi:MAG: autotransporter domain-containing protein [Nitrospinaceae bacterium]|nr:autotransporter domain-containing protein [Nitrospinaceae bacterium]NIR57192.1 autotransporter domain-containing protein [Nitrospinaceae bacterium]NIS87635.1 autotransporter domain-containing protein [Nitrospinaceae bacterium]NIT84502.1 autotransporter domain-containing protein [Nitrospinaceae bacterium]NIU46692.1 autotransporter domain-containing protein [Nitrospinaceae bacterium]
MSTLNLTNFGNIRGEWGVYATIIQNLGNNNTIRGQEFDGVFGTTIDHLSNSGTIQGGVAGVGADFIGDLSNSGIIEGLESGIKANNITSLTNSGDITASLDAIQANTISNLTNSGTIQGESDGLRASTITNLTNSGTIRSRVTNAVRANTISNLTNSGTIGGVSAGVLAFGSIGSLTNSGTISGSNARGVFVLGNLSLLDNSGTISGGSDGAAVRVNGTLGTLNNSGGIGGFHGVTAGNIMNLTNSGNISGAAFNILTNSGGTGVSAAGTILNLDNTGTIQAFRGVIAESIVNLTNSGTIQETGSGFVPGFGVVSTFIVNLDNSGVIDGGESGIEADFISNLTNSGSIDGGRQGLSGGNGIDINFIENLTNSGDITSHEGSGVLSTQIIELDNSGDITASIDAIQAHIISNLTNSGTIFGGIHGVFAFDSIGNLDNSGTISGELMVSLPLIPSGVFTFGSISNLNNSGSIAGRDGIFADSITTLNNSGTISGDENNGDGVSANIIENLNNSGTIFGGIHGVFAFDSIENLTNTGTIMGIEENGIETGTLTNLTNSGIISGGPMGIQMANGTIVNSGKIRGKIPIVVDRSTPGNASVTNSGLIASTDGHGGIAIHFQGVGDDTLTVQTGSVIIGRVNLGAGTDTVVLQQGAGQSTTLSFDSDPEIIINGTGRPVASGNNKVAVVDTTALSLYDDVASGLTSNIGNIVSQQASGGLNLGGFANRKNSWQVASNDPTTLPRDDAAKYRGWFEGFGGINHRATDRNILGATTSLGGAMAGIETGSATNNRYGLFLGASFSRSDVDLESQDLDAASYFGGLYTGHTLGKYFVNTSLSLGGINFDSDRFVNAGTEIAKADYTAFIVSPQVTVARAITTGKSYSLVPSVRVGYTGIFVEGFQETGSSANLTMAARDQHMVQFRTQMALQLDSGKAQNNKRWSTTWYAGLDGRANLDNDQAGALLLGQQVTFDPGGRDEVLRGFGGLNFIYTISDTLLLDGGIEAGGGTDKSEFVTGRLRAVYKF